MQAPNRKQDYYFEVENRIEEYFLQSSNNIINNDFIFKNEETKEKTEDIKVVEIRETFSQTTINVISVFLIVSFFVFYFSFTIERFAKIHLAQYEIYNLKKEIYNTEKRIEDIEVEIQNIMDLDYLEDYAYKELDMIKREQAPVIIVETAPNSKIETNIKFKTNKKTIKAR